MGKLAPVLSMYFGGAETETDTSLAMLYARISLLRCNLTRVVFWATYFKMKISTQETHILDWVSDFKQSLPCFTLLDSSDDPCGILLSVDRVWASQYKEGNSPRECEFILLSTSQQFAGDELSTRTPYFHKKYVIKGNPNRCFVNVMLIEYDTEGIAFRRGIGKIHKGAFDNSEWARKIVVLG